MKNTMNRKIWLSALYFTSTVMACFSQGGTSVKSPEIITRLNIGDRVPDIRIQNVMNAKSSIIDLSAYKGKLLLLDFWETSCLSCMRALPKIEKLKKQFSDKMEVITVTRYGTKEEVTGTLQNFKILKDFNLPTVIGDDKLYKYFPFKIISHVVWIGGDGVVKAITGTEHIKEEYIKQVLEGKPLDWPVKNDIIDFDYNKPLLDFNNPNVNRPHEIYSSAFTGSIEGVDATTRMYKDSLRNTITINHFNAPLISICKSAITGELEKDLNLKDVILEVKDTLRFRYLLNLNGYYWSGKSTSKDNYSYSAILPADLSDDAQKSFIREDISRWLKITNGISVKKEDRTVPCLKLIRTNKNEKLFENGGEETMDITTDKKMFKNSPVASLVGYLNSDLFQYPFIIDETGLPSNKTVTVELTTTNDLGELQHVLSKYGFALVEGTISRNMYVITEVGSKNH